MLRTLFNRKCGSSDFLARRDDVKCEKSLAYKNRCLNVRSATASRKKNRNVRQNLSMKSINKIVCCHAVSPNASRNVWSYENDVCSSNSAGISKKFTSFDSVDLITAWKIEIISSEFVWGQNSDLDLKGLPHKGDKRRAQVTRLD